MSRVMRKLEFCLCKNKGVDLCSKCTADLHLCFCYTDSRIPPQSTYTQNFKILAFFQFVSDLVGNP